MQLVIQPYHKKEFTSFRVPKMLYKNLPGKHVSFRIRSRAFCQLLAAKMEWNVDKSYRIPGMFYPEYFPYTIPRYLCLIPDNCMYMLRFLLSLFP